MAAPTLFLIDGSNQMYRAYHAIRGLTGPDGKSTNAVYGFVTMLRKLLADHNPAYIAASFDLPDETFRARLSADYKANRTAMPDDLKEQIAWVHEACEAMGVPIFTMPGFEADDVIGTLAKKAAAAGYQVAIVTGDKDFFQMVGDGIRVYNPRDDGAWYDEAGVAEKFGVPPHQVVDVLALMGDTSDNVKGVPGIGEKGARDLITNFGSLDALLARADEVTAKKQREGLKTYADQARQSRELVTIHTDVDVAFDPEQFRFKGASRERCYALFSALGFRTLVTEFAPTAESVVKDYRLVDSLEELETLVAELARAPRMALRLVCDGTAPVRATLVGLAVSTAPRHGRYIPLGHRGFMGEGSLDRDRALALLKPVLTNASIGKVGHDIKADLIVLGRHGIRLDGLDLDTMLAAYLLDANRSSQALEPMALEQLGYKAIDEDELRGKGAKARPFADVPADAMLTYAGERADLALQLADAFGPALATRWARRASTSDLELPLVPILAGLERTGVRVDVSLLAAQASRVDRELAELSASIFLQAGETFNIGSPKQLADVLFEKLKLPVLKRTGTTRTASTAVEVLEELALTHDLPRMILDWRGLAKLKGTYIDALPTLVNPETGRVHTQFNQAVAATGRLSSSDPNLQNIPIRTEIGREIRRAFIAAPGAVLISADYSQIELRVLAHLSGDETLIAAFERGDDIHDQTALKVFGPDSALSAARAAAPRQDHQLRAALREDGVHPGAGHRRAASHRAGLHRRLLRGLPAGARVHRPDARGRPPHRRGEDDVRAPAPGAGGDEPQRPDPRGRRAHRREHADPGHRRRHPEARDDRRRSRARGAPQRRADDPHGARRTAVRGAERRGRPGRRPGEGDHGRRGDAARAPRCGRRDRPELEGRQALGVVRGGQWVGRPA